MLQPVLDIKNWQEQASTHSLMEWGEQTSLVLDSSSKKHYWRGSGPLSLKFYLSGKATFKVGNRKYIIDEQSYLVLNDGEPYEVIINEETDVEAFCLFFRQNLISDYARSQNVSDTELLGQPFQGECTEIEFCPHTFKRDEEFNLKIHALKRAMDANVNALCKETLLQDIIQSLVNRNHSVREKEQRLDFVKKSTRDELITRLLTARDFIHGSYQDQITLGDIAQTACLSVNHLLRTFKQAFRQTPNQYIQKLRIEKAKHFLIRNPQWSITKICFECGFKSLGYFSSLFKRSTGITPTAYRKK